jgi:membrane associated rhomboid family serine protease
LTFTIIGVCTLMQIYATWFAPDLESILGPLRQARSIEEFEAMARAAQDRAMQIPMLRFGYEPGSGIHPNLVASAFVHDGWFHLIGNMLFLWLAGSALEDRLGRIRFLILYLASAAVAAYAFAAFYDGPPSLLVGASGAVTAVMGAFLIYFFDTRVLLWYWFFNRTGTFRMAAYLVLPLWLGEQVFYAYLQNSGIGTQNIAYTGHIAGFLFGFGVAGLARIAFGPPGVVIERVGNHDDAPVVARADQIDVRYRKCLDAADAKDVGSLRTQASRVIIDLSRANDHERIVELYQAISRRVIQMPLTDAAFLAAATAAEKLNYQRTYLDILEAAQREHPGSRLAPEFRERLASVTRR